MLSVGSSPRVRGLRPRHRHHHQEGRIIPARAGFTSRTPARRSSTADHPRACGVYNALFRSRGRSSGSSPRVRGLHEKNDGFWHVNRIIPARAGFTAALQRWRRRPPDHPRACGVYMESEDRLPLVRGSSPRVRGLLIGFIDGSFLSGIIPARAGFTASIDAKAAQLGDHPRACGVYLSQVGDRHLSSGSSPRVRGLLASLAVSAVPGRIIPARAGFTPHHRG